MTSSSIPERGIRDFWRTSAPPLAMLLFFVFVSLGSSFIVFAKLFSLPNYFVALVPVAIMVSYAALALLIRSVRLRDDQTGDNLYYMGFIFTLTSLAVALYQFGDETGFDEIVRNFGVAISSTITGIGLRVMFNQMRQDPIEVEHAARQELAEAARLVRGQLNDTVLAFNHFRTRTLQSLEEIQDELRKRLKDNTEAAAVAAVAPVEDAAAKIARSVNTLDGALTSFASRLCTMETPDRLIEIRLEPVINELTSAIAALARQVDTSERSRMPKKRSRWLFWRRNNLQTR